MVLNWSPKTVSCAILAIAWAGAAAAQISEEDELALSYGDKSTISITTGFAQPITRAPAVATVITAQDIEAMGATDLNEVMETVPGVHVSHSTLGYAPIYQFRGITSADNAEVLMLQNGIPMTSVFLGDRGATWAGLPVDNIARIEVIRGPGSALYGADAYAGVINIITKTAADINGTQVGARVGSFNSKDAWLLHGGQVGDIQVAGYLRLGHTDGARETIAADAQTVWDSLFHTQASHAPGPTDLGYDSVDGSIDLAYQKWRFRGGLKQRNNVESGPGVAQALDPTGRNFSKRITADLTYQDKDLAKDWDITLQGSYYYLNERSDLVLFPPGAFGGAFPNGMIGNPYKWERHTRFAASAFYTGFADHRINIGAGRENDDLYKIQESKNYAFVGGVPTYLGSVMDASAASAFMSPHDRIDTYLYAQDQWHFAKDWYVTGGIRHDNYSDFGGTTNPRLALVWEASYDITAKLLAGRAFRAPSFVELYNVNNPVQIGNPNLRPETISTVEAAVSWQPSPSVQFGTNLFKYAMQNIIRFVPNTDPTTGSTAQNTGGQRGYGLELEASWSPTRVLRLSGNYALQRSTNVTDGADAGDAPHHHLYLRGDWRIAADWTANAQANWISGRDRVSGDVRPTVPDYHTVDLTLRNGTAGHGRWDFAVSARNLFNAAVFEPSPAPGNIPNDFPMAGRSVYFQARYGL
jgi:outer membrane receptor for ferrienterochelin and colicins